MKVSLKNWAQSGWLVEHASSPEEMRELMGIARRDLKDCQTEGLSDDWRFNIAYNAALQLAIAALAAAGYRASRDSHHYRVIQSLALTVGADADLVSQFDAFRKKRNISAYERMGTVSQQECGEMVKLAMTLEKQVRAWLKSHHPKLV